MQSLFKSFAVSALVLGAVVSCSRSEIERVIPPLPHFDLEMTGREYAALLSERPDVADAVNADPDVVAMQPILELGKRNLDWLIELNKNRSSSDRISLSSKETAQGFPIHAPREYNTEIVLKQFSELKSQMPQAMRDVLFGTGAFPKQPTLDKADYIHWGNQTDRVYQIAVRWLMAKQYLSSYEEARKNDIRGYFYLSQIPDLDQQIEHWVTLPESKRAQYQEWWIGSCANTTSLDDCRQVFAATQALATQPGEQIKAYWNKYRGVSQAMYEDNFRMQWQRYDITWSNANPDVLDIPVLDPKNAAVADYLKTNVEDEWKWNSWHLRISYKTGDESSMTRIQFQPGVTAHVEVPNLIVMDENQPLTEYDSQWTIRHEFGHILGFPDCYVEFYDTDREVMVSYQLDTSNLMCSRQGQFKQIHFDELKRVYFK